VLNLIGKYIIPFPMAVGQLSYIFIHCLIFSNLGFIQYLGSLFYFLEKIDQLVISSLGCLLGKALHPPLFGKGHQIHQMFLTMQLIPWMLAKGSEVNLVEFPSYNFLECLT
jgi:hypothetical protein